MYLPTNSLFGSNSSKLMTSMPCFFIIGTTLAAILFKTSLAISSSGPFRGVMNLLRFSINFNHCSPYSIIWMSAMVVIPMNAHWHPSSTKWLGVEVAIATRSMSLFPLPWLPFWYNLYLSVLSIEVEPWQKDIITMRPFVSPFQGSPYQITLTYF